MECHAFKLVKLIDIKYKFITTIIIFKYLEMNGYYFIPKSNFRITKLAFYLLTKNGILPEKDLVHSKTHVV